MQVLLWYQTRGFTALKILCSAHSFPPTLVTTDPGTVPTALCFPGRRTVGVLQCVVFRPRYLVFPFSVTACTGAAFHGPFPSSAFSLDGGVYRGITCLVWGSPDEECACRQNLADGTSELVFSAHPCQAVVSGTPSLRDGLGPRLSLRIPGLDSDSAS